MTGIMRITKPCKISSIALMFMLGMSVSVPTLAINCAKAKLAVEKRICANASLHTADSKMNVAYTAILKAAPDAEIRDMLVRGQRHWVEERNNWFSDTCNYPIVDLRKAIEERARKLDDRSEKGLIALAQAQRQWLAKYTGGLFAGFAASCGFIPTDSSFKESYYSCLGTVSVQHHNRICSIDNSWASYRVYTYYGVSTMEDGKAKPQAFCSAGDGDCRDKDAPTGWTTEINDDKFPRLSPPHMSKLDAELWWPIDEMDREFLDRCLTDPEYPIKLR